MKSYRQLIYLAISFIFWSVAFMNVWTSILLMVSMLMHEIGHFLFMAIFGLKPRIGIIPILGAETKTDGIDRMSSGQEVLSILAGPTANIVLIFVGFWIYNTTGSDYGKILASLNAVVGFFNLLPIYFFVFKSDGWLILGSVLYNLFRSDEWTYGKAGAIVVFVIYLAMLFWTLFVSYRLPLSSVVKNPWIPG